MDKGSKKKEIPNLNYEQKYWEKGFEFIAGLDEVGRGSFAGPVVAGCVVFDKKIKTPKNIRIDDSKKLTPDQRLVAKKWIIERSLFCSVGEVGVEVIDNIGIGQATHKAFRKAVKRANNLANGSIEFLLIDSFYIPYIRGFPVSKNTRQEAIKKGDSLSLSIAAASILAKVYRDSLMEKLSQKGSFEKYLWHKNKGYGTKDHREAIQKYGITKYHRKSFLTNYI